MLLTHAPKFIPLEYSMLLAYTYRGNTCYEHICIAKQCYQHRKGGE
jgi:hypothetical protein